MPEKKSPDSPQKRRIKIILEYLGTNYAGWQYQKNALSIQEVVENAIDKMMTRLSRVTASGRTDAGVHALYQPAHVDVETRIPDEAIIKGMNCLLPDDIAVKEVSTVPPGWSAMLSAKKKKYRYTILNSLVPSVFDVKRVWRIINPLDVSAMRQAGAVLTGEHDFTSFRASGCSAKSPARKLDKLTIEVDETMIYLTFTANGFLKQMARNIVGTLVDVGLGKISPADIAPILEAKDRTKAGPCAPAEGLCLISVVY